MCVCCDVCVMRIVMCVCSYMHVWCVSVCLYVCWGSDSVLLMSPLSEHVAGEERGPIMRSGERVCHHHRLRRPPPAPADGSPLWCHLESGDAETKSRSHLMFNSSTAAGAAVGRLVLNYVLFASHVK